MNVYIVVSLFVLGLILIVKGGDWFVDASVWVAETFGIPHFIIGATIVSIGTTMPELFVSASASLKGVSDIAIGNSLGSTICNTGLIAGFVILFSNTHIDVKTYFKKGSFLLLALVSLFIVSMDLVISHTEAFIFLFYLVIYIYLSLKVTQTGDLVEIEEDSRLKNIMKFIFGLLFIIVGSNLLVDNGILLAEAIGVPEGIIALSLVALGTSLPELITSVSSLLKGKHEIGLGNIIGANILNFILIIPVSSLLSKNGLELSTFNYDIFGKILNNFPQTLYFDIPFSFLLISIFIIPSLIFKKNLKIQGLFMLLIYISYIVILFNFSVIVGA